MALSSLEALTHRRRSAAARVLALLLVACVLPSCRMEPAADRFYETWEEYGGSPDNSKFVRLDQVTPANVGRLQMAWFYPTGDDDIYQFNPIVVDSTMYVLAKQQSLVALDAATGEEKWVHADLRGIARRGINYWESKDGQDRRLLFQMNDYLQAIDAETGASILTFGENGLVDLRQGLGRDPETISRVQSGTPGKVYEDLIILGSAPGESYLSAPGHIRAFNVVTGEQEWIFHTIPHPGEFGYETWPKDAYRYAGGVNTWGEMSLDVARGIVYVPLGSPTYDYYGADRIGQNLFGTSLVALDARTGKRLWHYQLVHHDLWDYDPAAAPQLITVTHDGQRVDAVAQAGKNGFLYVFDRVTGEPLWPIEERPVPPSDIPGEQAWPTQPFPTQPPPFERQTLDPDSLSPYFLTDEERAQWAEEIRALKALGRTSLYTPLSDEHHTVAVPGAVGGANWGNSASHPEKGLVYIMSLSWPSVYPPLQRRVLGEEADDDIAIGWVNPAARGQKVYKQSCQACHGAGGEGIGAAPSLVDVETRLSFDAFQQVVGTGRGKMPAFSYLSEEEVQGLYRFFGGTRDGAVYELPEGPVVARGGAPGGQTYRPAEKSGGRNAPYPEGVAAPSVRYYMDGWGLGYAYLMPPPWATITAYDLNTGTVKWRRPLGTDQMAALAGGKDTGVQEAQRNGMIVTATGLLFATAGDGKVYAFDAETGQELWQGTLPTGTEGLPSMYEVGGKQYLVVTATTPVEWGRGGPDAEEPAGGQRPRGGYMVFALPDAPGPAQPLEP